MPQRELTIADLRGRARRHLPRMIFDFLDGGAEDEVALRRNRRAFDRLALTPSYLADVADRDLTTTVLGRRLSSPVLLAPAGLLRLLHPQGEVAAAEAATARGQGYVLSTAASASIEEVAGAAPGPRWFQLYLWRDREVVAWLVERALEADYDALCLTVDVPAYGQRERDLRNGFGVPLRITPRRAVDVAFHPRWLLGLARTPKVTFANLRGIEGAQGDGAVPLIRYVDQELTNPAATWDELAWLRSIWPRRLVVKGVLDPEDARRAVDAGADGIVVSNHGGRQLDTAPASMCALPAVVAAVGDAAEVLLDSGVRRGSDVAKALALGARACLVGRPYLYGLAAGGRAGVGRALEIFDDELSRTLALVGCRFPSDLRAAMVTPGG